MNDPAVLQILRKSGVFIENTHRILDSGRHTGVYLNKNALYSFPQRISQLCELIARRYELFMIDAVIGSATGGIVVAQWVAFHLSQLCGREVRAGYAEKGAGGTFVLNRGYADLVRGLRVLLVEDVLTTGQSVRGVKNAVQASGGDVCAVAALCNRGEVTEKILGVPLLLSLADLPLQSWEAHECPICASGGRCQKDS